MCSVLVDFDRTWPHIYAWPIVEEAGCHSTARPSGKPPYCVLTRKVNQNPGTRREESSFTMADSQEPGDSQTICGGRGAVGS